jgi:hypothetical protein
VALYVAWAYRLVGCKYEGYGYLDQYLTHRTLLHIPLGLDNPILDVFNSEFNAHLTLLLFGGDIRRRLLPRVSPVNWTSAPLRF